MAAITTGRLNRPVRPASGGSGAVVAHEDRGLVPASRRSDLEQPGGDLLGHVGLAAVLADVGGHLVDDQRATLAMEGDRGRARLCLSVVTDDAHHRAFLLLFLKPGSQSAGSGRYAVSTMISSSSMLSRTATWMWPRRQRPRTSRAG